MPLTLAPGSRSTPTQTKSHQSEDRRSPPAPVGAFLRPCLNSSCVAHSVVVLSPAKPQSVHSSMFVRPLFPQPNKGRRRPYPGLLPSSLPGSHLMRGASPQIGLAGSTTRPSSFTASNTWSNSNGKLSSHQKHRRTAQPNPNSFDARPHMRQRHHHTNRRLWVSSQQAGARVAAGPPGPPGPGRDTAAA